MLAFIEYVVRAYVESLGFYVRSLPPARTGSRRRTADVFRRIHMTRVGAFEAARAPEFLLFTSELNHLAGGWFFLSDELLAYPGIEKVLRSGTELQKYVEKVVLKKLSAWPEPTEEERRLLDEVPLIWILPTLPTAEPHRSQICGLLQERNVQGVLSFRTMLTDVIEGFDTQTGPDASVWGPSLAVMKMYDLTRGRQDRLI